MSSGFDGSAPDHAQDGHQLISAAQRARSAYGSEMSPADREAVFRSLPEILDDTGITPSAEPHQTAERVSTRSMCSFDFDRRPRP